MTERSPSVLLLAAADRIRDLAGWAAPRDASWFNRPNTHEPKRWHVANADGLSLCYQRPLVETIALPLADVPEDQRCQHWGCRRQWPGVVEPPRPTCAVDGCDREVEAKSVCKQHGLNRRRGHALRPIGEPRPTTPIEVRFWESVDKRGPKPERDDLKGRCWVWTRSLTNGYGSIQEKGTRRKVPAHRFSYELHGGTLIDGLDIDHLCRNRACVNPAHLELVTTRVNIMRSPIAPAAVNARKTHCKRGHPFDEANTRHDLKTGRRACRTCGRERQRQRAQARRAGVDTP